MHFNHVTNRRGHDVTHPQKKEGYDRHEMLAITTSKVKPHLCLHAHTFILQKEKMKTATSRVYSNHQQHFLMPITPCTYILKRSNQVNIKHHTRPRELDWCIERCGVTYGDAIRVWNANLNVLPLAHHSFQVSCPKPNRSIRFLLFAFQLLPFVSTLTQGLLE